KEKIDTGEGYPADYISEAIDQTRGWFYTLLAVATLLEKERPFKHVVCLGHVLDTKGKKMSKSLGNIIDPFAMMEKYGADAVRWYMYTINQPGESKRFDEKALDDMVKKVFLILWNVYTFYEMFAGSSVSNTLRSPISTLRPTHLLDRWILSRLHSLVKQTTDDLESYKIIEPARAIAEFINDLSTWYLRRSRDRFKGEDEQDKQLALNTLRECLLSTVQLMAPFTPFLSEHLYLKLGGQNESVHLEAWPLYKEEFLDGVLIERMGKTRSIISRLLERRLEVGIPVRQVLSQAKIFLPKENSLLEKTSDQEAFIDLIKDEANIKEIVLECGDDYKVELDINLTPELIREGTIRELTRRINTMRKDAGLTIEDRIELFLQTDEEEVKIALEEHRQTFLNGVLATTLRMEGEAPDGSQAMRTNDFDLIIGIEKK
ncbi:hypothetical protein CO172_01090, partial [Candidatus Uhrbacteria bacterium CG_4_9_14_3_um_filter_36_7]